MLRPRALVAGATLVAACTLVTTRSRAQTPYGVPPAPQPYPQQPYPQRPSYPPQQPYPQQQYQQPPYPQQQQPYPPVPRPPAASNEASLFEISTFYGTSVAYGVGLGVWLDAEMHVTDPGVSLIAPAILGVGAPVGVYFLDQPSLPRGEPAAISAGLAIGAAEGLGIAGTEFATAKKSDAWGFRGLSRSVALGATLGGVGGYALGEFQEPSPKLSAVVSSGGLWGMLIGASIGYGTSRAGVGYGQSNDHAAIGGLIGLNVGLAATAGLSMAIVPSWNQIEGMWEGAGIGAAISLPVFLFYAGKETPPAKRGLVFTGTAMLLGIAAGAVFSSSKDDTASISGSSRTANRGIATDTEPRVASLTSIVPFPMKGGAGLSFSGVLY